MANWFYAQSPNCPDIGSPPVIQLFQVWKSHLENIHNDHGDNKNNTPIIHFAQRWRRQLIYIHQAELLWVLHLEFCATFGKKRKTFCIMYIFTNNSLLKYKNQFLPSILAVKKKQTTNLIILKLHCSCPLRVKTRLSEISTENRLKIDFSTRERWI